MPACPAQGGSAAASYPQRPGGARGGSEMQTAPEPFGKGATVTLLGLGARWVCGHSGGVVAAATETPQPGRPPWASFLNLVTALPGPSLCPGSRNRRRRYTKPRSHGHGHALPGHRAWLYL